MIQQGDVLLYQTNDDGEINIVDGLVEMTGDFRTAAYLSLFGGNEDDDGRPNNPQAYWGNLLETEPAKKYVSEFQNITEGAALTSSNLIRFEDAAKRDLNWFLEQNIASSVEVVASIPALNTLHLVVRIIADGVESTFEFTINWRTFE